MLLLLGIFPLISGVGGVVADDEVVVAVLAFEFSCFI